MDFFKYLEDDLNISLNKQQMEALKVSGKKVVLEACPGSGKTTTLVSRNAYLILSGIAEPSDILTLSFSRASARDMEKRFYSLFGSLIHSPVHFSTIHSFCYGLLKYCAKKYILHVPELLEGKQDGRKLKILRNICFSTSNEYLSDDALEEISNGISLVKNKLIPPQNYKSEYRDFPLIFEKYERYKNTNNLIDFDDILSLAYSVLKSDESICAGYAARKFVHVDEAQDVSLIQHKIIELLSKNGSLFMVGDTDQSIYGFRGADPEYIVNIKKIYPDAKIIKLEINYRSTGCIVEMSNNFIMRNAYRHPKRMETFNEKGKYPEYIAVKDSKAQVSKVIKLLADEYKKKTAAVLYRNNLSGIPLVYELIKNGTPFYMRDNYSSFFRHPVIADVFNFFHFSQSPEDIECFKKIYYKMGAPFPKTCISYLESIDGRYRNIIISLFDVYWKNSYMQEHLFRIKKAMKKIRRSKPSKAFEIIMNDLSYGEYIKRNAGFSTVFSTLKQLADGAKTMPELKKRLMIVKKEIERSYRMSSDAAVCLLTLHGSKGLEFDKVILIDLIDGHFPSEKSLDNAAAGGKRMLYEEEARLFYVGVTRARSEVYLIAPEKLDGKAVNPSRFIKRFLDPVCSFPAHWN
ncbi:MAG TPA: ATP-dependent helicase [Ruminiclostridium sp.]|nr:ATP-dependent helicase [Ruminiclostridium sp.]